MTDTARNARPWPAAAPRCKQCGKNDQPHYGRGLCGACYQWLARRDLLGPFPLLPYNDHLNKDSWRDSLRHNTVHRNHRAMREEAWERQRAIWQTDGPLIDPASCEVLTTPTPRWRFAAHGSGVDTAARRAA